MPTDDKHQTDAPNVDLHERKREFGSAVKEAREAAGLTQKALAERWYRSRPVVTSLEGGTFDRPSYGLAHQTFDNLPIIAEFEEYKSSDAYLEDDPERVALVQFETMLLDRTRELKTLLGTWHALWETEVDGQVIFNSEVLEFTSMRSRRRVMITNPRASLENPVGGYAWRAECRFVDGTALLGVYMSTVEENVAKGALQMCVHPHGRFIEGQWIGEGFDHQFSRGHVVFCRERDQLTRRMEHLLGRPIDFEFKAEENRERKSHE